MEVLKMDKNNQKEKIKDKPIQDKEDEKLTDEELDKVSGGKIIKNKTYVRR